MIESIYTFLSGLGYRHPLHPAATHLPVGLVIGSFIFLLVAWVFGQQNLGRTALHCLVLALLALLPTALLGYMDWQHFYAGAWLFPIKIKLALGGVLMFFLLFTVFSAGNTDGGSGKPLALSGVCLILVISLGFFGGELIYGKKAEAEETGDALIQQGATVFNQSCSACHYTDQAKNKIGPGLKGLFQRDAMPSSGRPVNEENIRVQLKTPFSTMPAFADMEEEDIKALIAYLKTI